MTAAPTCTSRVTTIGAPHTVWEQPTTTLAPNPGPAPAPVLRLLPVPQSAPPYDDEPYDGQSDVAETDKEANELVVQGALALAFALPGGLPVEPEPSTRLRAVPDLGDDEDAEFRSRQTPRASLPNPRPWAARLVQALVEVVTGERPNAQLVRWTSMDVHEQLDRRVRLAAAAGAPGVRRVPRWLVRSVHVSEPADGVAEVCALVARAGRHAALALRLEGVDGRWRCTALELGW